MKKLTVLLTVIILCFYLFACGKEPAPKAAPSGENTVSGLITSEGGLSYEGAEYERFGVYGNDGKDYYFVITDETELLWEDTAAFEFWSEDADPWEVFGGLLYVDVVYGSEISFPHLEDEAEGLFEAVKITVTGVDERYANRFGLTAKPVIYLYPERKTEVEVKLNYDGVLTCTYPVYNDGWRVSASPDGTLTDENGQEYNYLYWEGEADIEFDFSKGFCVKGEDTAEFLENALSVLGLTRREANEFIVYWLPLMEKNPYNIISFQDDAYTMAADLKITPAPDTVLRVYMAWKASEDFVEIEPQELCAVLRTGFTVVEWGGTEVK